MTPQVLSHPVDPKIEGEAYNATSDILLDRIKPLQKQPFAILRRIPSRRAEKPSELDWGGILQDEIFYYSPLVVDKEDALTDVTSQLIFRSVTYLDACVTTFHMIEEFGPTGRLTTNYANKFTKLHQAFDAFKQDFDEVPRRITRCMCLEEELAALEDLLDSDEAEYLVWCISLIKDVLSYNYAESLNESHLRLLKDALQRIFSKESNCTEDDYQDLHNKFLKANLALLPTSCKALKEYQ